MSWARDAIVELRLKQWRRRGRVSEVQRYCFERPVLTAVAGSALLLLILVVGRAQLGSYVILLMGPSTYWLLRVEREAYRVWLAESESP